MILPNEIIELIFLYTNDIKLNIKFKNNYNVKQLSTKYNREEMVNVLNDCIKYKNKELTEYFSKYYTPYTHNVTIYKVGNLELFKNLKIEVYDGDIDTVLKLLCKKGYVKMLDYLIKTNKVIESYQYQYITDRVLNRTRNINIYYDIAVKYKKKQMIKYLQNQISKILFI